MPLGAFSSVSVDAMVRKAGDQSSFKMDGSVGVLAVEVCELVPQPR